MSAEAHLPTQTQAGLERTRLSVLFAVGLRCVCLPVFELAGAIGAE